MKSALLLLVLYLPIPVFAQQQLETVEFTGIVKSIEPGYRFALERITLDVDGEEEFFHFLPNYGELIARKIKVGDRVSLKAAVDLASRKRKEELAQKKTFAGWIFSDRIEYIKIEGTWYDLRKPSDEKNEKVAFTVFLDRRIKSVFYIGKFKQGLILDDGIAAYKETFARSKKLESLKEGDLISFIGFKLQKKGGYQFPIDNVAVAYTFSPLRKETGIMQSLLFKQNHTCIGVKFETSDERDLMVSFPSERAMQIKTFLKPDKELTIYYGEYSDLDRLNLPELHAIIQDRDTLFINDFGFYGGPDSRHDHTEVDLEGKIYR
ncbi:MAG TPA: hypothetical protein VL728_16010, partial [Cyclobacteriaceae bacterium]|nr:hypothetical protein [Cyclobacteriaceae bacterium]